MRGRWLSEPKAWWNEAIVKGLALGWGKDRDALESGGIRRDGWRLITHLCFSSQHRGSHCWEWCAMVWHALWGWGSLSVSAWGCCGSFGVLFFCFVFSLNAAFHYCFWSGVKHPECTQAEGAFAVKCLVLQSSLWRDPACSWLQACWGLATFFHTILGLSGTFVVFNIMLWNSAAKLSLKLIYYFL